MKNSEEEADLTPAPRKRRAERRAHRQRFIVRALRVARLFGVPSRDAEAWAKHNADNLKTCSCWMCGHVRKWHGAPFGEVRRGGAEEE